MKKNLVVILSAAALLVGCVAFSGCSQSIEKEESPVYTSPVVKLQATSVGWYKYYSVAQIGAAADPWVYYHTDGYYYMTATYTTTAGGTATFNQINIRKSKTINGLRTAAETTVIDIDTLNGWGCYRYIWAPELHNINGVWYMFFTASSSSSSVWSERQYVAKCSDENPVTGTWSFVGQVASGTINGFSVDGTVFEVNDQWYYIWSQYVYDGGAWDEDGSSSNDSVTINGTVYADVSGNSGGWACLFIGKTSPDDFTTVTDATIISVPQYTWECTGVTSANVNVNEGPAILQRNGKVFVVYSASACDESYCLGLLSANQSADLCSMSSWTKASESVFKTSATNNLYGPGHCSFTTDGDYDVIVYHCRPYSGLYSDASRSTTTTDGFSDPWRETHAKVFTWNADGTPNFGVPE
jgi:GH43 family beta-xylosidase